jgi:oxygen-dependent protoporphyrinogen oxidase
MTFASGAQVMVDALEAQLTANIMLNTGVKSISRKEEGYAVHLANGEGLTCDAVILTVPANQARKILADLDPASADLLGEIEHKNIGTATLIYKELDLDYEINGLMIPRREKRRIDAITWTTNKPMKRGPEGYDMLRVFFGGGDPSVAELPEGEIVSAIRAELEDILGITAEPVQTAVFCWPESFPQAAVGHQQLVDRIDAQLPAGIRAVGSSYRGIGIPDCIRQGRDAAEAIIHDFQQDHN